MKDFALLCDLVIKKIVTNKDKSRDKRPRCIAHLRSHLYEHTFFCTKQHMDRRCNWPSFPSSRRHVQYTLSPLPFLCDKLQHAFIRKKEMLNYS